MGWEETSQSWWLPSRMDALRMRWRRAPPSCSKQVTDVSGMRRNCFRTWLQRSSLRSPGYSVFAIGVADVDFNELQEIATKPSERHVFVVDDFDAFDTIKENLINFICETATSSKSAKLPGNQWCCDPSTAVCVKIFACSAACPLIFLNGFTSPGEFRLRGETFNELPRTEGMLVLCRIPDARDVQPHGEDLQLCKRCFHGARLLQQLHILQNSQKRLPDAAINVSVTWLPSFPSLV